MVTKLQKDNSVPGALELALSNLREIIAKRIQSHLSGEVFYLQPWLKNNFNGNLFSHDIANLFPKSISEDEWIILMLSIVAHVQPNFFESIISEHLTNGGDFPEFGGVKGTNHRGMLPTGETAQFILAGNQIQKRLEIQQLFAEDHFFYAQGILWLEPVKEGEPFMSGRIIIASDWLDNVLFGKESVPRFGLDFPAKLILTQMKWADLVLHPKTLEQVNDIRLWMEYNGYILKDPVLKRKIKPGYRVLFYGPSGTGKTLTASLLGNEFRLPVYRIDLSQVVSKFIGETEKNLENIFARASRKNWILFFDEADALFGKRTSVSSAHDKYANQEVSYLLQRIEEHEGLLILASNFKSNIDDAFLRRFHSIIHFPMPGVPERHALWLGCRPESIAIETGIDWQQIAASYEISGASIVNVVQYAGIKGLSRPDKTIRKQDIVDGIRREFRKEEKNM